MKKKSTKRRKENSSNVIAYSSLAISLLGIAWNVFFGYGRLVGKIDALQEDLNEFKIAVDKRFDKLESKFDRLDDDFHKMDIRVNTLEQRKH